EMAPCKLQPAPGAALAPATRRRPAGVALRRCLLRAADRVAEIASPGGLMPSRRQQRCAERARVHGSNALTGIASNRGAAERMLLGVPLARKLGPLDATMIVVSGIIGSGIFINPYLVAREVETPFLILAVWVLGGVIALCGAFVFAELGTVVPRAGGQYAF